MASAFEIAITPVLFGGLGYLLDSWLGSAPAFTLLLGLFGITGVFVKMWYVYDQRMGQEEQQVDHTGRSAPPLLRTDRNPA